MCEVEVEKEEFPPPLLRTLTRTQTPGWGWAEGSEAVEVWPSSAHTCSQLPSFQIGNLTEFGTIWKPVVTIVAIVPLDTHHPGLPSCLKDPL